MKQEEIPALIKRVHDNAVKHGWHDETKPKDHWLMMIISEISEMVEADRKYRHTDKIGIYLIALADNDEDFKHYFELWAKDRVEDEMADVCISILDMAGEFNLRLDLNDAKVTFNDYSKEFTYRCYNLLTYIVDWDIIDDEEYLSWRLSELLVALSQWAEHDGIDLDWHIRQKMHYNELRPYKHGKKY